MLNIAFLRSTEGQGDFIALMLAQHKHTYEMLHDWRVRKPWEYGSIDSCDYMEAALRLSADFAQALLDDPSEFMAQLSYQHLIENYACDGVCNELWEKYPDPERNA